MVGSQIAVELSKLKPQEHPKSSVRPSDHSLGLTTPSNGKAPPIIGSGKEWGGERSHSKQPVCAIMPTIATVLCNIAMRRMAWGGGTKDQSIGAIYLHTWAMGWCV